MGAPFLWEVGERGMGASVSERTLNTIQGVWTVY